MPLSTNFANSELLGLFQEKRYGTGICICCPMPRINHEGQVKPDNPDEYSNQASVRLLEEPDLLSLTRLPVFRTPIQYKNNDASRSRDTRRCARTLPRLFCTSFEASTYECCPVGASPQKFNVRTQPVGKPLEPAFFPSV